MTNIILERRKNLINKIMYPYIHLIPFQDRAILYLNGSMKCIQLSTKEYMNFCKGIIIPQLCELLCENERMYNQHNELRLGAVGLTLNIANKCNLHCSYCYANGGNYHSRDELMHPDVAAIAIRKFAIHFGELKRVKFFGGEPFLNPAAIRVACETCIKLTSEGILKQLPDFTAVTNGSILTQELIDLINKYNIGVTVSYDGERVMQDILRPDAFGKGSNERVLANVQWLQVATNYKQPSSVEVTYTQLHMQNGVSVEQCYNNVKRFMNVENIKITPVSCKKTDVHYLHKIDSFHAAIKSGYKNNPPNRQIVEKAYRLYQILQYRKKSDRIFCGAGINRFSVSADGRVYPCYLFTNDDEFCIGNVLSFKFSLKDYETARIRLMKYDRFVFNECKDCWASSFCFGCRGNNRRLTGNADVPSSDFCEMLKEIAENLLCCMLEMGEIGTLDDVKLG